MHNPAIAYNPENLFARMLRGQIPARIVHRDDTLMIVHDIAPVAPVHWLAIPCFPAVSFQDFVTLAPSALVADFFSTIARVASEHPIAQLGYRLITNHGADAHQEIPHFHVHVLGGEALGPLRSRERAGASPESPA
jgi:diadenosine tetraphosphate (Ap4A) HIT family hydrolase